MNADELPLSFFEVECDGSACGSAVGWHVHPPQHAAPALGRVRVCNGQREVVS